MKVEQSREIDVINVEPQSNSAVLTITDHLTWDDVSRHLSTLEDKLNTYLSFIESGEVFEAFPPAVGKKFRIDLVYKYRPPGEAIPFLERVNEILNGAGFTFWHGTLDESETFRSG